MGWHWKQTRWNEYALTGPATDFDAINRRGAEALGLL